MPGEEGTNVKKMNRWWIWLAVLADMAIIICLSIWVPISTERTNYWDNECTERYTYDSGDADPCVVWTRCAEDPNCRVRETHHLISGSLDDNTCDTEDCGGGTCSCILAGTWSGLYTSYLIFFVIAMVIEVFKFLFVASAVMMNGCDNNTIEPVETSSVQCAMDSWTLVILKVTYPKRYDQLLQANDEGKIPVVTKWKVAQWLCREFVCGLIITLYPIKVEFFNGCELGYILSLLVYIGALWVRYEWHSKNKSTVVINQPQVITMVQIQQQQQVDSHPNTTSTMTEGS